MSILKVQTDISDITPSIPHLAAQLSRKGIEGCLIRGVPIILSSEYVFITQIGSINGVDVWLISGKKQDIAVKQAIQELRKKAEAED